MNSFHTGYGPFVPVQAPGQVLSSVNSPVETKPILAKQEPETKAATQESSAANSAAVPSSASENDEGRHRTHPLYAMEPEADGLYHCPYKADNPDCGHKPTKLKCNYEYELSFTFAYNNKPILTSIAYVASSLTPT